ncbi:hypothetical protein [Dyadobacter sp. CY347]|uniref:hypothetical protein n=1 Tax=Dyadobacter sp. CY347 TaxID=2909336 RepID=UPI001F2ED575|nr:hypothetical protein [Dyadobacter sp. CY347]MCF2490847.1 hypothetical protein [Dyadobacter sp. CY347]
MFKYNPSVHREDDIIEYILNELIKPEWAGGCLQVPDFCRTLDSYDRFMEQAVRQKMYSHKVAQRCNGINQPETAIMISLIGINIAKNGGWKVYLKNAADRRRAERQQLADKERARDERDMFETERSKLESIKTALEIENLTYEKETRELNERIKRLSSVNLQLQNADFVGKWISGILGVLVTMCISIITEAKFQAISRLAKAILKIWSSID